MCKELFTLEGTELHCVYLPQKQSDLPQASLYAFREWSNLEGEPDLSAGQPKPKAATATPCAAQKVHRDPRAAVSLPPGAASPAPSPSPFPVMPDSGFAFCSNKENVIKNLLTLVQREAVIAAVTAGEWAELSVPLLFSAPSWKQLREGLRACPVPLQRSPAPQRAFSVVGWAPKSATATFFWGKIVTESSTWIYSLFPVLSQWLLSSDRRFNCV